LQHRCGFSKNIRNYVADFSRISAVNLRKFKFVMYHRIFDIENRLDEGVSDNDILDLVNTTGWSCSEMIWPQANISVFADAYRDNGRVLVGMLVKDGASGHMAMVSKVKIYSSGSYKVYFSETSPIPHVPAVSSNLARDLGGARYYSFKLRY
jgi:hypothetical protein